MAEFQSEYQKIQAAKILAMYGTPTNEIQKSVVVETEKEEKSPTFEELENLNSLEKSEEVVEGKKDEE